MKLTNDININVKKLREELNLGKSFDVIERIIEVHNHKYYFYFLDVGGGEFIQRLCTLAAEGEPESSQAVELNLVAIQ